MAELTFPWLRPLWKQWAMARTNQGLPHALGLAWEPQAGSEVLLDALVAWLLCLEQGNSACGHCKSCLLHQAGNHPDYVLIAPEDGKKIGIDRIRALQDKVWQRANQSGATVVVIQQAEMMTEAAANGLLKTLEEPPQDNYLILCPERFSRLIPTVRSRLTIYNMPRPSLNEIENWLRQYAGQTVTDPALLSEAQRKPLSVLEQLKGGTVEQEPLLPLLAGEAFKAPEKAPEQLAWIDQALESLVYAQRVALLNQEPSNDLDAKWHQCLRQNPAMAEKLSLWYARLLAIKEQVQGSGINGKIVLEQFVFSLLQE
ncbi:DNA polymerase III subunit delta' [Aliidiomarina celeris]|uniref:DNA polymerase III subunit delta' n=1 Tax=Aliidiomarina celeris TaxID=2249428 RepID=UPI000DE986D2|nr:DNA polymerase III subunit delta' [Aliidiomarina celeris]